MESQAQTPAPSTQPPAQNAVLDEKEQAKKDKKKEKELEKAAKIQKAKEKEEKRKKEEEEKKKKQESSTKEEKPEKASKKKEKTEDEPFVNTTPKGEKKDTTAPMRASYDPKAVEAAWYDWWVQSGFFKADNKSTKEKFVIVIPPPNVTGSLHLGHGLTNAIQDAITRWHRMSGRESLWVPGTDHAGIATQTVVEKRLFKEKKILRAELGREKFIEEVWKWKEQYGGRIVEQLKRIGSSVDWEREVFTMDAKLSRAVTEAFVRMHDQGLIYRAKRLVNWCCKLNTAISDIEVDHLELEGPKKISVPGYDKPVEFGILVEFAYKVDGSDEELVVATTRPETMLGDTAVAVHPDDTRYKHLHGKFLKHPFLDRKIPVVTDGVLVDMSFGTGAVKVTPAHDFNDFLCGKRNNLELINILNNDGTLNNNAGPYAGKKRFEVRELIIADLKKLGLYKATKPNKMAIATCSRSKDIIEPYLIPQWYVKCKGMADASIEAVKDGSLEIIPASQKDTWFRWLGNIQDWCISRQLWWGHRCPAYLVCEEGKPAPDDSLEASWIVARNDEEALKLATEKFPNIPKDKLVLKQDPDVLDTWFSSGLFPFSVFGWPDNTADLAAFYPTSLLETGQDILFFWVARMVMMGIQLTGKLPFKQVFLHSIVRDAHGRKMSKSLGNVIDPIDMIEGISLDALGAKLHDGNLDPKEIETAKQGQKEDFPEGIPECGTDAMRFALCAYLGQGRDINLDVKRVAAYRNFCNKLWNATKFAVMNLGEGFQPDEDQPTTGLTVMQNWILSRLHHAINECNNGFKVYDLAASTSACYSFWLYDLCDVYLESMKPLMQKDASNNKEVAAQQHMAKQVLYTCLENGFRLLHPFMPFVTEELWQRLPKRKSNTFASICIAPFPKAAPQWENKESEAHVALLLEVIRATRSMRTAFGLTKQKPKMFVSTKSEADVPIITKNLDVVLFLASCSECEVLVNAAAPVGCAVEILNENMQIHLQLKGLVDASAEIVKLEAKLKKLTGDYDRLFKTTQDVHYHKVPENKKQENTAKLNSLKEEQAATLKAIDGFKQFLDK